MKLLRLIVVAVIAVIAIVTLGAVIRSPQLATDSNFSRATCVLIMSVAALLWLATKPLPPEGHCCECESNSYEEDGTHRAEQVARLLALNTKLRAECAVLLQCNDERLRLFRFLETARLKTIGPELQERAHTHIETHVKLNKAIADLAIDNSTSLAA